MTGPTDVDAIPRITLSASEAGSGDVVAENIAALKALFPSIVTDGRVDFEVLRQLLGDAVEESEERYGLNWKGKRRARGFALTPTLATLRPAMAESKDWDSTQNIVIEGDNLEVLKCLRRSYAGQVKLIYIDPPYNTGNDFVYPDNYADSLGNFQRLTGQRSADGTAMTTNKEASGRFHTDWLNMMYPRLMLAKELLRNDGIMLISIDEAEAASLALLCRNAFGDQCHVASFVRRRRMATGMRDEGISPDHEYVLAIATDPTRLVIHGFPRSEADFPFEDEKGRYRSTDLTVGMGRSLRPNQFYPIINPRTGLSFDPSESRVWRFEPGTMARHIEAGNIIWPDDQEDTGRMFRPRFKTRWSADEENSNPVSTWIDRASAGDVRTLTSGMNEEATREARDLMGSQVFDYPKPVSLLKGLVRACSSGNDLILDFFAGSGTTGHAVMAQNATDCSNRRYILVQLPEPLDPANTNQKAAADFCEKLGVPLTIAELTKERLRRAGAKIASENPGKPLDTGFRVYKLASSNLKPWAPDTDNLAASLLDAVDNIVPGRSEEDLLVELLLKTGIDLTMPMASHDIAGRTVHALGGGVLIVCLSEVADADAEALGQGIADWHAELDPVRATTFYFRDSGFKTAAAKANVAAIIRQRVDGRVERLASI